MSGGTSPYAVTVNGVTHNGVTGSTTFTGLPTGTYPATISDAHSCPGSAAGVLVVQPSAIIASASGTDPECSDGTGTITVTASGGTGTLTYSKDGTNFQASNEFAGLAAGDYTITVKDANGCTRSDLTVSFSSCGINFCPSPPCDPPSRSQKAISDTASVRSATESALAAPVGGSAVKIIS